MTEQWAGRGSQREGAQPWQHVYSIPSETALSEDRHRTESEGNWPGGRMKILSEATLRFLLQ